MIRMIKTSENIFGMSRKRSQVAMDLEDITLQLTSHLIKLYMYPTSEDTSHWRQEIYNFLHNVPKLKMTKKFPSKQFILDNTININKEMIKIWYKIIDDDYSDNNNIYEYFDFNQMKNIILNYYDWLADNLSQQGIVSRKSVYNELERLGL